MTYFFILIFIFWACLYFFLLRKRTGPMDKLREAKAEMSAANDIDAKREAARDILEIIERYEMAGVIVDDTRKSAEAILGRRYRA